MSVQTNTYFCWPPLVRSIIALSTAAIALVLPLASNAQPGTGAITGTVINGETDRTLAKAEIEVEGTQLTALTNPDGTFRINGVPAGTHTVVASYAGLAPAKTTVTVAAGAVASADLSLTGDLVTLSEFKVTGVREGNAYAVQQQRTSESQRLVVAADAFGIVADSNPGEFLKSMPGMTMEYTGIEPRRVSIRGLEPSQVQVLLNGNQIANAASASLDRAFDFDHTSIDAVEAIDVSLAHRPDMPANSISGSVNIVTRSALMKRGRRLDLTLSLTGNDQTLDLKKTSGPNDKDTFKTVPGFSVVYSDSFLEGRLGVAFSASVTQFHGMGYTAYDTYTYGQRPSADSEQLYHQSNTTAYLSRYRREQHQNYQVRAGSSLGIDYKLSEATSVFLKTLYTDYHYQFRNRFLQYNVSNPVAGWNADNVEAGAGSNVEQEMGFGDKLGRSLTFNVGASHSFDKWKINYDTWHSRASSHYEYKDFFGSVRVRTPATFTISKRPGTAFATVNQLTGNDAYSLGSYAPNGNISSNARIGRDQFIGAKGSVRRNFDSFQLPLWVEGGVFFQEQERSAGNHQRQWAWAGVTNLAQFAEDYDVDIGRGERAPDRWISAHKLHDFAKSNPGLFVEDPATTAINAFLNDRRGTEKVSAGYVMANVEIGKFDILTGFRVEETVMESEGGVRANGTGALMRASSKRAYRPWPFKDLHIRYNASRQLQARVSYTEAYGRPNLSDLIPSASVSTGSVPRWTVSNINLKPQRAKNLDAAVEYYISGTNYVSAGWFQKDIKNYINNNVTLLESAIPELGIPEPTGTTELSTRVNLPKAVIQGYELSGRYALPFVPKTFGEVELWGNYTHLYSIETYRASFVARNPVVKTDYLPNIPPRFWNAGIAYRSSNSRFSANLKGNFNADKFKNFSQTRDQVNERLTIDGDINYRISRTYRVTFAVRNITDADEGETQAEREVRVGNGGGRALALSLVANF